MTPPLPARLALYGEVVRTGFIELWAHKLRSLLTLTLLMLGVWWRRLSTWGAMAGLVDGGLSAGGAILITMFGPPLGGWPGALLANPAMWATPLALATAVGVSLATPGRIPPGTTRTMVRLHTPERVVLGIPARD